MTPAPQISVPGPRSHTVLSDLLAATKYKVLVSAVYGAGESVAVSAMGWTGKWAARPQTRTDPDLARPQKGDRGVLEKPSHSTVLTWLRPRAQ